MVSEASEQSAEVFVMTRKERELLMSPSSDADGEKRDELMSPSSDGEGGRKPSEELKMKKVLVERSDSQSDSSSALSGSQLDSGHFIPSISLIFSVI